MEDNLPLILATMGGIQRTRLGSLSPLLFFFWTRKPSRSGSSPQNRELESRGNSSELHHQSKLLLLQVAEAVTM